MIVSLLLAHLIIEQKFSVYLTVALRLRLVFLHSATACTPWNKTAMIVYLLYTHQRVGVTSWISQYKVYDRLLDTQ